jgi:hypothetical protein
VFSSNGIKNEKYTINLNSINIPTGLYIICINGLVNQTKIINYLK